MVVSEFFKALSARTSPLRRGHQLPYVLHEGSDDIEPAVFNAAGVRLELQPERRPRETDLGAVAGRSPHVHSQEPRRIRLAHDGARVIRGRHALLPWRRACAGRSRDGKGHARSGSIRQERSVFRHVGQASPRRFRSVPPERRGRKLLRTFPEGRFERRAQRERTLRLGRARQVDLRGLVR